MTITKGFWRTEDGNKAEVVDVRGGAAIGWIGDLPYKWDLEGNLKMSFMVKDLSKLSEPWIDKPEWDWSTTPPWLNWLAMDDDGLWYLFQSKPDIRSTTRCRGHVVSVPKEYAPKWSGDWKDSLVCRPGVEVKP